MWCSSTFAELGYLGALVWAVWASPYASLSEMFLFTPATASTLNVVMGVYGMLRVLMMFHFTSHARYKMLQSAYADLTLMSIAFGLAQIVFLLLVTTISVQYAPSAHYGCVGGALVATFAREGALLVRRFDLYPRPRRLVANVVLTLNALVFAAFVACAGAFVGIVVVEGRVVPLLEFVVLYLVVVHARFMAADASMMPTDGACGEEADP